MHCNHGRRAWLVALATSMPLAATAASPTPFPARTVTLVVPFPPGSGTDTTARIYAKRLQELMGQPVVIDNKAGGNTFIAAQYVARAAPDGYTLYYAPNSVSVQPALFKKLPYDPIAEYAPVGRTARGTNVVVVAASSPYRTLADLVAAAKKQPGQLNFASGSRGLTLYAQLLAQLTGMTVTDVAYKGAGPGLTDTAAGLVAFSVADVSAVLPLVQSGKLRALVVAADRRHPLLPEVPSANEAGIPDYEVYSWNAVYAPANTPQPILQKLEGWISQIAREPETAAALAKIGLEAFPGDARDLRRFQLAETAKWKITAEKAGMQPE